MKAWHTLIGAALLLHPIGSEAQDGGSNNGSDVSRAALRSFPVLRSLAQPPAVPVAGGVTRLDGTPATVPVTALLAQIDLEQYSRQLQSLFPMSSAVYPADSLRALWVARAAAWVGRLGTLASTHDVGVSDWELVPYARVAVLAELDSLACALFDARLKALTRAPAERAYVLSEAIRSFADPTAASPRLVARLAIAERYLGQLRSVPMTGYRTKQDSVSMLVRRVAVEDTLIVAYDALGDPTQVRLHAEQLVALDAQFTPDERADRLYGMYRNPAIALALHLSAPAQFDTLRRHFMSIVGSIADAWPAEASPQRRVQAALEYTRTARNIVAMVDSSLAWLGTVAPAVLAHAWINTADSAYRPTLRSRPLNDGKVRVLLFSGLGDDGSEFVLQRLQQAFPGRVEGVLVTSTTGANGPDLVEAAAEIDWLERYYVGLRRFTMPIAVWGGPKDPVTMQEGKTGAVPQSSGLDTTSYQRRLGSFVVLDGAGKVRIYQDAASRPSETLLMQRVRAILAESSALTGSH